MQIYWPYPVEGMDATFGTWHLVLAIFVSLTTLGIPEMWLLVTIVVAPLLVWTFVAFAYELTQHKGAALIAGLLYVVVGLSGDFRMAAYPNRMGQIVLWLAFLFMFQAVRAFSQKEKRSGTIFGGIAGLFAWTASAIHMQYGPVLLGLTLTYLGIAVFFSLARQIKNRQAPTSFQSFPLKVIGLIAAVVLIAGTVSFAVRTSYTISDKTPLVGQSTETGELPDTWQGVSQDLNTWFGSLGFSVTVASLFSLLLLYHSQGEKPGLYFILGSILIVPGFLIFTALFYW